MLNHAICCNVRKKKLTTNQLRPAEENYVQKPNKERDSTKTKKVRMRLKNSIKL